MKFTKMHGIGNDFIMVNAIESGPAEEDAGEISRKICHRKFGIGADGFILFLPSKVARLRMRMFNPDGTEAEMCGNGIRCFAKYAYERGLVERKEKDIRVETGAGVLHLRVNTQNGHVDSVRVDMGYPHLKRSEIPMAGPGADQVVGESIKVNGSRMDVTMVSMGNPHAVFYTDQVKDIDLEKLGPLVENHRSFPHRTNVHFVQVNGKSDITMRTWERGAGITLACGTGACACAVASVLNNRTGRLVTVHLPGGDLTIEWAGDKRVFMTGPAETVFEGEIAL